MTGVAHRAARRRHIQGLFGTADRLARRMGGRVVVDFRKLRDFVRALASQPGKS